MRLFAKSIGVCLLAGVSFAALPVGRAAAAPIDEIGPTAPSYSHLNREIAELDAAREAFRNGRVDEALKLLESAVEKHPSLPPAKLMLARLFLSAGQTGVGRSLLEQVAADHPNHPEIFLLFGNLALAEGRVSDAMLNFEKAVGVGIPSNWSEQQQTNLKKESFAGIAAVAERRSDWFRAQIALKGWSDIDSTNANVRDRLGSALFMLGRDRDAFEQFQTAARIDKNINPAEVSMGVMHARKEDYIKARQWFDKAQQMYPNDGRVYYELASMLLLQEKTAEAQAQAAKAAATGLDSVALTMQRGYVARQLKNFEEAENFFTLALQESPSNFEAGNQLALVLIEQPSEVKQKKAQQLAELNYKRFPQSSSAVSTLGWIYFRLGRTDDGVKMLQAAARGPQVRTETLYYLGRALAEQGQDADARKVAERVKAAIDKPGLFLQRAEAREWLESAAVN